MLAHSRPDVRPPEGEPGLYARVHYAARKTMGHVCRHCGATGQLHAALRPDTPHDRLRTDPRSKCLLSTDPADYEALCPACHYQQDFGLAPRCRRGHEYTPENTGRGKGGSRKCLTCDANHRTTARAKRPPKPARSRRVRVAPEERRAQAAQRARERYASDLEYRRAKLERQRERQRERYANDPAYREAICARERERYQRSKATIQRVNEQAAH